MAAYAVKSIYFRNWFSNFTIQLNVHILRNKILEITEDYRKASNILMILFYLSVRVIMDVMAHMKCVYQNLYTTALLFIKNTYVLSS